MCVRKRFAILLTSNNLTTLTLIGIFHQSGKCGHARKYVFCVSAVCHGVRVFHLNYKINFLVIVTFSWTGSNNDRKSVRENTCSKRHRNICQSLAQNHENMLEQFFTCPFEAASEVAISNALKSCAKKFVVAATW